MAVLENASTQYNDMHGTVAVDWHDGGGLHEFAAECGLDVRRFFPLAFSMYRALPEGRTPWRLGIVIYAADISVAGATGEEIDSFARTHDGRVPTKRFSYVIPVDVFFNAVKRFDLVLRNAKFQNIEEIEFDGNTPRIEAAAE